MTQALRPLIWKLAAAPALLIAGVFALRAFMSGVVHLMFAASAQCSAYGPCLPGGWMSLALGGFALATVTAGAIWLLTPRKVIQTTCPV